MEPAQQVMDEGHGKDAAAFMMSTFGPHDALLVKKTNMCCAPSEFSIAPLDTSPRHLRWPVVTEEALQVPNIMYTLEESSCCCRVFCQEGRPFTMKVSEGGASGGRAIVDIKKPCSCPVFCCASRWHILPCCCCCILPKLDTVAPSGNAFNYESAFVWYNPCVPRFKYSEGGKPVYDLRPQTCCGGCCVLCNCCSDPLPGRGCLSFYFHDPVTGQLIGDGYGYDSTPQIMKLSTADTFAVIYPPDIEAERKAALLGLTALVDSIIFSLPNTNA
eukprot:TRINITY_DN9493_c0_g1_i3.p1 TRINITY_DN9493_c0_g1~~TRINITY_DN9493_c0_g1_i3.p1  ORF type:complete len:273 (-),score=44.15 TRINITY_DN9493_c0_g1_i3:48-866(-)